MSDAGRYRHILIRTWLNPAFLALSDAQKTVAFYLLTGPPTNSVGLYRLSLAATSEDFGVTLETFRRRFAAALRAFGWRYDEDARLLWIPEWVQTNAPQSPNVVRGWRTAVQEIPDCPLKTEALVALQAFIDTKGEPFQKAFREVFEKAFNEASRKPPALTPGPGPESESLRRTDRRARLLANARSTEETVRRLRVAEHQDTRERSGS